MARARAGEERGCEKWAHERRAREKRVCERQMGERTARERNRRGHFGACDGDQSRRGRGRWRTHAKEKGR